MTDRVAEKRPGLAKKLAALAVGIVIGFAVCEVGARLVYPSPSDTARAPQLLFEPDPTAGFLHVPNQAGYLGDGWATINAIGLRGDLPEMPKPLETKRILAIGDSSTFGWGVGDEDTYCAALERLLKSRFPARRLEVVNGGVAAYDLKHEIGLLRRFAPILAPDVVLVGIFWNDLLFEGISSSDRKPDVASSRSESITPNRRTSKPFRLEDQGSAVHRLLRSSRFAFGLLHAWRSAIAPTDAAADAVRWEMAVLQGRQSKAIDAAWADLEGSLRAIRSLGETGGFAVGVVIMPIRAQVENDYPDADYQTRLTAIATRIGLLVIDPLSRFTQHAGEDLFLPYDRAHFTARGNALVAEAVADVLGLRPELLGADVEATETRR